MTGLQGPESRLPRASESLWRDGYFRLNHWITPALCADVAHAITAAATSGEKPVTVFARSAPWALVRAVAPVARYFLGQNAALLPNLWAWHIAPGAGAGWSAHKDYEGPSVYGESLVTLSLWLALTDATTDNGCMWVAPQPSSADDGDGKSRPVSAIDLPAPAGTVLGWRQDLLHGGGVSSADAQGPRVSVALEFQNPAFTPIAEPLLDPDIVPDLSGRLGLIKSCIGRYGHFDRYGSFS